MINGIFRPWGKPQWLFKGASLKNEEWFLIGVLSTQDRCLSMLRHQNFSYKIAHAAFVEIVDEPSHFSELSKVRRENNRALWGAETNPAHRELHSFGLFDPIKKLKQLVDDWTANSKARNVILDVSALPERFLFPLVRWLKNSPNVKNLVVTYMMPEKYTFEDLAYNAREASHLPTFVYDTAASSQIIKNVVVGVGFLPFSLPEWLKKTYSNSRSKVSLIFPFPSSPANVQKGWEFVRRMDEPNINLVDDRQIARVAAHDISGCFERINLITATGSSPTVFAPFGPKAHSVAMCLQAINLQAEAYFTHPSFYHPEYSTGIKMVDGIPEGFAYAIRIGGVDLYP